jgi:hypothetical protein
MPSIYREFVNHYIFKLFNHNMLRLQFYRLNPDSQMDSGTISQPIAMMKVG